MSETIEKRCLDCGKPLPPGRTDKRYCDDICRARATRTRNRLDALTGYEDRHTVVIRAIKKNYALLKKAIGEREEWIVDFDPLYRNGFQVGLYTSSQVLPNGRARYYCFELGWEEMDGAKMLVTIDHKQLNIVEPNAPNLFAPRNPDKDK